MIPEHADDYESTEFGRDEQVCGTCLFFYRQSKAAHNPLRFIPQNQGWCKRYPPVLGSDSWASPLVSINDVCGEWKEKRRYKPNHESIFIEAIDAMLTTSEGKETP